MEVALATGNERQVWVNNYFSEYVRASGYKAYMGKDNNSIIIIKYELQEENGKTINIPLITRLKGNGVTGSQVLDGNEEELGNFNCPIVVDWRRNGVRVPKSASYKTEINLFDAAKMALKTWESEKLRDDVTKAFLQLVFAGSNLDTTFVDWASATAGNKNSWVVANADRVLFGATKSNYNATFATALGNVDTTSDKATVATMELGKRIAKAADPHIRPYKTEDGREFYVSFHGSRTFRDIKADASMQQVNRDARAREGNGMDKNPIFQDGDLIKDGIIYREVPEIDALCTALGGFDGQGAASCDVRPIFLAGAQAVGVGWGQEPTPQTDLKKDYNFRPGVAIEELLGVRKLAFNGVQQGLVTIFVAAAADS